MAGELVLGIESSCDDSAVALVRLDDGRVEFELKASQDEFHREFGGVVPEIAARRHLHTVPLLVEAMLREVPDALDRCAALAVCRGPGLLGSLLVGYMFARGLHAASGIPLYAVHHLRAHLWAGADEFEGGLNPPFLGVIVSGGHTTVVSVDAGGDFVLRARTRDDAMGEVLDKVGRLMGLPYPAGPHMDACALARERAAREGRPAVELPVPVLKKQEGGLLEFSFSGLKSASVRLWRELEREAGGDEESLGLARGELAHALMSVMCEHLCERLERILQRTRLDTLVVSGGVAASGFLRRRLEERFGSSVRLLVPSRRRCTDNGVMVAQYGRWCVLSGMPPSPEDLDARATLSVEEG